MCYQGKITGLCEYFSAIGLRIIRLHNNTDAINIHKHVFVLIVIHADYGLRFCRDNGIVTDFLFSMATYAPNSLSNSKGLIPFPKPPRHDHLSSCVLRMALFISEHNSDVANKVHFAHHIMPGMSDVVSIPWGLSISEEIFLRDHQFNSNEVSSGARVRQVSSGRICLVGLIREKYEATLDILDFLTKTYRISIIGPDASMIQVSPTRIMRRVCIHRPEAFMHYLFYRHLIGDSALSVHHSFELEWQTTYNERSLKVLACGMPLFTDNPYALQNRLDCQVSEIGTTAQGRSLYFMQCVNNKFVSELGYRNILPSLLDMHCNIL